MIAEHAKRLWPRYTFAPTVPFWGWALFCASRGDLRIDHIALALVATGLAYVNAFSKRVFLGLFPMGLVALFYDGMRYVKNVGLTEASIHICDLRAAEARWFGMTLDGRSATVHDWLQRHTILPLDVLGGLAYGTFLYVVALYGLFLLIRDFSVGQRFMWGFFLVNMVGFITYHAYPAAPPWYYHAHGCIADLAARPSAGPNLMRVDALLGFPYFGSLYARSSDVFGAVPSLHVAYPMLMVIEGWSRHRRLGRTLLVGFYVWMCCSAVYLDHHWIIDVLLGSFYSVAVALLMRAVPRWVQGRRSNSVGVVDAMPSR